MEEENNAPTGALLHSEATKKYLGKRVNRNTAKGTQHAMRVWFKSMFELEVLEQRSNDVPEIDFIWSKMVEKVIIGYNGSGKLTDAQLQNLNVSLGHMVSAYRKKDGQRVSPSTMNGYIDGINRFLNQKELSIDIRRDKTFVHPEEGFMTAFENITKLQQAEGIHRKPYNIILDDEMEKMLSHELSNPMKPRSYVTRTIIVVGMLTGLRPTGLRLLTWSNFKEGKDYDGQPAFLYTGSVGGLEGDCKNQQGGVSRIKDVPTNFYISDAELAFGINPYKVLKFHQRECIKAGGGRPHDGFFMAANQTGRTDHLLRRGVIGRNLFRDLFSEIVDACGVVGVGFQDKPKLHSLRSTLISKLQRSGHSDNQIVQRTGHKSVDSLKSYTSILGSESKLQQEHIFTQIGSSKKPKIGSSSSNPQAEITTGLASAFNNITANQITINYYANEKEHIVEKSKPKTINNGNAKDGSL